MHTYKLHLTYDIAAPLLTAAVIRRITDAEMNLCEVLFEALDNNAAVVQTRLDLCHQSKS